MRATSNRLIDEALEVALDVATSVREMDARRGEGVVELSLGIGRGLAVGAEGWNIPRTLRHIGRRSGLTAVRCLRSE